MEHSQPDITTRISERQMRLWNALHSAEHAVPTTEKFRISPYRFLTLSRDDGSLGDEIAVELANRLKWHLFDKEIVNYIAENSHVREDIVRQLDEKSQSLVQEAILRLLRMPERAPFGSEEYHESLLKTLATLATRGGAILVGRGTNFALRWASDGLHVRITGTPEVRAKRVSERWQMPMEKARHILAAADAERRDFIRHHYHKNFDDLGYYDLVFNTDHVSVDRVANSIACVMLPEIPLIETRVS
jgi:cytidylate kinase